MKLMQQFKIKFHNVTTKGRGKIRNPYRKTSKLQTQHDQQIEHSRPGYHFNSALAIPFAQRF